MDSQKPMRIYSGKLNVRDEKKIKIKVISNTIMKTVKKKALAVTETSKIDKKKSKLKKKINKERTKEAVVQEYEVELDSNQQSGKLDSANADEKRKKVVRNKNRKNTKLSDAETTEILVANSSDDVNLGKNSDGMSEKKKSKSKKKKRNKEKTNYDDHSNDIGDGSNEQNGKSKSVSRTENDASLLDDDEVYQISSGDEDETTGMKKWITEYHDARPGVEILWQRINDFLVDYRAQKETEREEREAEAAEGGWTVVAHHKGRKKTIDSATGITVGSVAQAAVIDKMSKKKNKQAGLNFYRFQRREAQRNEIMMLQSKFEQDKKRILQMRAARKFRPY